MPLLFQQGSPVIVNDSEFVVKLMNECCSICQPHASQYSDIEIPKDWRHMPWDEFEMKNHDLITNDWRARQRRSAVGRAETAMTPRKIRLRPSSTSPRKASGAVP